MLLYWIWFAHLPGLPLWAKKELLQHFRDPEELYFANREQLPSLEGITEDHVKALEQKDLSSAQKILDQCRKKDILVLTMGDWNYPLRLKEIPDPPVVLYYKGRLPQWDAQPAIGVVGTRRATGYGLQMAFQMGKQIAQCGGLVVSGAASGIDTKAMHGALEEEKSVVGVLGCGVDVIYPRNNRKLYALTIENGCLLSEFAPGEAPLGWHFPQRNRIISGISNGVVVVEAPEKSGALNTARHAKKQGRDVFAVPANVGIDNFVGSNALLEEGATAAVSGWRVVREYACLYPDAVREPGTKAALYREAPEKKDAQKPILPEKQPKIGIDNSENTTYSVLDNKDPALTQEEQAVLALVGRTPQHPDVVAAKSDLPAAKVQSIITRLTVRGLLARHGGGRISLK
jgi:DNA processing protein